MNYPSLLWLAVPALALFGWLVLARPAGHDRIDGKQARQLVHQGARLVDVRTAAEFDTEHIPGAVNISVQELSGRIHELEPKNQPVVLYCRSGHRSGIAFDQLKRAGFNQLYDLGPMTAW